MVRSAEYATLAKGGFGIGVAMVLIGILGMAIGHALFGSLPGWEETLFLDMEALGIVVALVSPFLFGVLLPLTE